MVVVPFSTQSEEPSPAKIVLLVLCINKIKNGTSAILLPCVTKSNDGIIHKLTRKRRMAIVPFSTKIKEAFSFRVYQ